MKALICELEKNKPYHTELDTPIGIIGEVVDIKIVVPIMSIEELVRLEGSHILFSILNADGKQFVNDIRLPRKYSLPKFLRVLYYLNYHKSYELEFRVPVVCTRSVSNHFATFAVPLVFRGFITKEQVPFRIHNEALSIFLKATESMRIRFYVLYRTLEAFI